MRTISISENGIIRKQFEDAEKVNTFSEIFLCHKDFEALKKLTFSTKNQQLLSYTIRVGGVEEIRVANYVGVIQLNKHFQIEILPKNTDDIQTARQSFLKMLKCLPNSPFKQLSEANLARTNLPIFEILISAFAEELERVFSVGLARYYQNQAQETTFIRGKIKTQITHATPNHFYCEFDEFSSNLPQNRLIKACVIKLLANSTIEANRRKLKNLLQVLFDVKCSDNYEHDFQLCHTKNRLWQHYDKVMLWVNVFLNSETSSIWSGDIANIALLFPTERLFEAYISTGIKKYLTAYNIQLQGKTKYLIDSYLAKPKYGLKPDIVLRNEQDCFVIDAKWKLLNIQTEKYNYGIEQSDLYQMYAYGKKYQAKSLFLIFPANANFKQFTEPFIYDDDLTLFIIPFDLSENLNVEVNKLQHFLSS